MVLAGLNGFELFCLAWVVLNGSNWLVLAGLGGFEWF